jgi:diaminopimelate epimerase
MAEIAFYKFHGTGNDFILIDDRNRSFSVSDSLIEQMCDRHFGIGADGLILLREKEGYDFEMIYFNADGKEGTMCGNGGRCIVAFSDFLSLIGQKAKFLAVDGEHHGIILDRSNQEWMVRLKMSDVLGLENENDGYLVDTGSPHLVCFAGNIHELDVYHEGRKIRYSDRFIKKGVNVDFAQMEEKEIYLRTYERGVEKETLSCGTGATATALAYAYMHSLPSGPVSIRTKGGTLTISFKRVGQKFHDIWLEGPAKKVFQGICTV